MSNLNVLYYLCQCSLGLTPTEAFLYRELNYCPLKSKEIIPEVDKFEYAYSYTDWALSLDPRDFVKQLSERHQGLQQRYIFCDWDTTHTSSFDLRELLGVEFDRTEAPEITHRYNRETGRVESRIGEEEIANSPRTPGLHPGAISINDDVDEPLPDNFWSND